MKETEITIEILEPLNSAKEKILQNGFYIKEKIKMIDYYYSKFPIETLKNFEYSELIANSFLVREVICEDRKSLQIIYKNKVLDSNQNVISEGKIKCNIDNLDNILKIFDFSKLNCWCILEQHMTVYENDKTSFVVQEIDDLGNFIEYEEDENMSNLTEHEKIQTLTNRLKDIGLNLGDNYSCKKVYLKFQKPINKTPLQ